MKGLEGKGEDMVNKTGQVFNIDQFTRMSLLPYPSAAQYAHPGACGFRIELQIRPPSRGRDRAAAGGTWVAAMVVRDIRP